MRILLAVQKCILALLSEQDCHYTVEKDDHAYTSPEQALFVGGPVDNPFDRADKTDKKADGTYEDEEKV